MLGEHKWVILRKRRAGPIARGLMRKCSVCNLQEYQPALDERLRAGESCRSLALEFSVTPDAMERHRNPPVIGCIVAPKPRPENLYGPRQFG
jgi:hypothetical protein